MPYCDPCAWLLGKWVVFRMCNNMQIIAHYHSKNHHHHNISMHASLFAYTQYNNCHDSDHGSRSSELVVGRWSWKPNAQTHTHACRSQSSQITRYGHNHNHDRNSQSYKNHPGHGIHKKPSSDHQPRSTIAIAITNWSAIIIEWSVHTFPWTQNATTISVTQSKTKSSQPHIIADHTAQK